MQNQLPTSIREAIESKKQFFWGENGAEWKLQIVTDASFIEKIVGSPVLAFADNGYGDYLFLRKQEETTLDDKVFIFFHETQEIGDWKDSLRMLLGQEDREPSKDSYPCAIYESGETVLLGDKVRFKSWLFFWKGWMEGTVQYVPGISARSPEHEYNGLKWVSIKGNQMMVAPVIDPKTGIIKEIRFVERAMTNMPVHSDAPKSGA
jgi:hypothetical protein